MANKWSYPVVRRDETAVDERFGVKVADPYQWLEDPDSEETTAFVKAQNSLSEPYISKSPVRNKFHERLTELYNYPKYSVPYKCGERYFYHMNTGLQNQSSCTVTDDGRYLLLFIVKGAEPRNKLYYFDLSTLDGGKIQGILPMKKLIDNFDSEWNYVSNDQSVFTLMTDKDAPRKKLVRVDINKPEEWTDLVPEHDKDVLEWATPINHDKLVLCYVKDVKSALSVHQLGDGSLVTSLPLEVGSVGGCSGRRKDSLFFYSFFSFLTPGIIFYCDFTRTELKPQVFREIKVKGFDASLFEAEQVFYTSKDGTKIPMFIIHRKGVTLDGSHPTILYGYGGFNISIKPSFSATRIVFMQHLGGVVANANLRGGGEYGDSWHKDGMLEKKQNVFDDFHSAAEYLIEKKYTSQEKLIIQGGSNGGLLVCACANQRPDLYGCLISHVGVLDMLKFHKFTIGHAWCVEYGDPDEEEEHFQFIYKYSPLHNIPKCVSSSAQYPAVLLLTADHDDRVVPLHSFKFISQLQHYLSGSEAQRNPLMIRIETKAGHGAGKPTTKMIDEQADIYSFISSSVGLEWKPTEVL